MATEEPLVIGYDWDASIIIKSDGVALDTTGWQITAQFYWQGKNPNEAVSPDNVLLTIVSGDGSLDVVSAVVGSYAIDLTGTQTALFDPTPLDLPGPAKKLAMRLSRTDSSLNKFLCDATIKVRF